MQLLSDIFLVWYYITESGLVIELKKEMFEETRYSYEIFSIRIKVADTIFILSYIY
jgi:hypothetical protein